MRYHVQVSDEDGTWVHYHSESDLEEALRARNDCYRNNHNARVIDDFYNTNHKVYTEADLGVGGLLGGNQQRARRSGEGTTMGTGR